MVNIDVYINKYMYNIIFKKGTKPKGTEEGTDISLNYRDHRS